MARPGGDREGPLRERRNLTKLVTFRSNEWLLFVHQNAVIANKTDVILNLKMTLFYKGKRRYFTRGKDVILNRKRRYHFGKFTLQLRCNVSLAKTLCIVKKIRWARILYKCLINNESIKRKTMKLCETATNVTCRPPPFRHCRRLCHQMALLQTSR